MGELIIKNYEKFSLSVFDNFVFLSNIYKSYYNYHKLNPKTFEKTPHKYPKDLIHIYCFDNNLLDKEINGFKSLTYNLKTQERIYIKTDEKDRKVYTVSRTSSQYFREFDFILKKF